MTLTMQYKAPRNRKAVYLVDVESSAGELLPKHVRSQAIRLSHGWQDPKKVDRIARYVEAYKRLRAYANAKLVVTSRLHVALPCAALGTPALFVWSNKLPGGTHDRLRGLSDFVHVATVSKRTLILPSNFSWTDPPRNPNEEGRLKLSRDIHQKILCHPHIADAARKFGMIPKTETCA